MTTLLDAVARQASRHPRRLAVANGERVIDYGGLQVAAESRAKDLAGLPNRHRALQATDAVDLAIWLVSSESVGHTIALLDGAAPEAVQSRLISALGEARGSGPSGTIDVAVSETGDLPGGVGVFTSGVSGPEKCALRPWSALYRNAAAFAAALELTDSDTVLSTSPPHHSYGFSAGLVTALSAGAGFVSSAGAVGPRQVASLINRYGVSVLMSVPLLYRWFAVGMEVAKPPRLCVSAGAPLPAAVLASWAETLGWPLVEHYGNSEIGQLTVDTEQIAGSVGGPIRDIELRLVAAAVPGTEEVEVRSALAPTILVSSGEQQRLLISGWYATGDYGVMDDEGRLFLRGRRGDTINIAGNKIAVLEVEETLRGAPGVEDCALVAASSPDTPTSLWAFIEVSQGYTTKRVQRYVREHLSPHERPSVFRVVDALPRTSSGKLRRALLHDWAAES